MNFGENLRILRKNSKISQEALADKVGVSRQAVSRWEVGDAYPEMSNIIALCSIFKCNINDLINDNIVDIESFDKETQEGIVKFKKDQQKKMKGISKTIYVMTNITKIILAVPAITLIIATLLFPFMSKSFDITEDKIKILNHEFDYSATNNTITVNGNEYYVETTTDLHEFFNSHDKTFFIISVEYILICFTTLITLVVLGLHKISKLYKNIYEGSTPFTIENEKLVKQACSFFIIELILQKITALAYSAVAGVDLAIDMNLKDLIFILIGVSIVYIFKYGRMIQADTKAKIYD